MAGTPLAVFGVIVPQPGEQAVPFCVSVQDTPLLVASFAKTAVNCCVALVATLTTVGEREIEVAGRLTCARPSASLFVTEFACTNTPRNVLQGTGGHL